MVEISGDLGFVSKKFCEASRVTKAPSAFNKQRTKANLEASLDAFVKSSPPKPKAANLMNGNWKLFYELKLKESY